MHLLEQLKIFPLLSQGKISQTLINIYLWFQVVAFQVTMILVRYFET